MMENEKQLSPIEAKSLNQICSLKRDNISTLDYWILLDVGKVHIHKQKSGHPSKESITISRAAFNKFIKWYQTKQNINHDPTR